MTVKPSLPYLKLIQEVRTQWSQTCYTIGQFQNRGARLQHLQLLSSRLSSTLLLITTSKTVNFSYQQQQFSVPSFLRPEIRKQQAPKLDERTNQNLLPESGLRSQQVTTRWRPRSGETTTTTHPLKRTTT